MIKLIILNSAYNQDVRLYACVKTLECLVQGNLLYVTLNLQIFIF